MFPEFELEQYLLKNEYKATHSLCSSGLESMGLSELLALSDSDVLSRWNSQDLNYSQPLGQEYLREEISRQYLTITQEQVCVFAGAAEAILCTLQGLLQSEEHVVVVTPCYQSLETVPASTCDITRVMLDESNEWQLNLNSVKAALKPNTKLIVMNFPNNPTGAIPDKETMAALIEMARCRGIYIFSDEVYRLMELDPANRLPAICDWYERGISVSSMSKPYGLPGLRIGWLATRAPEVIDSAVNIKHYTSICPNSAGEILAFAALRNQTTILERNLRIMRANLVLMEHFFKRVQDECDWVTPKGGCLGFVRLLNSESAENFATRLLDERGVLVLAGNLYGDYSNRFRIGFGRKDTKDGLAKLESFLKGKNLPLRN